MIKSKEIIDRWSWKGGRERERKRERQGEREGERESQSTYRVQLKKVKPHSLVH